MPWRSAGGYCMRKKTGSEAKLWAHTSHFRRYLTDPKRGQYGVPFENLETNKD